MQKWKAFSPSFSLLTAVRESFKEAPCLCICFYVAKLIKSLESSILSQSESGGDYHTGQTVASLEAY